MQQDQGPFWLRFDFKPRLEEDAVSSDGRLLGPSDPLLDVQLAFWLGFCFVFDDLSPDLMP
jgi:hypothetical protein